MVIKQLTITLLCSLCFIVTKAQKPSVYRVSDHIGKARVHIETSAIRYRNASYKNNPAFGFGVGGEFFFMSKEKNKLSLSAALLFHQAGEELKTYSVENNSYYYRSTTLTGRLLLTPALHYKRNISKQFQAGLGFQPQFVLHEFKDYYEYGVSASTIPDVTFRKTDVAVLASLTYLVSPKYAATLVAQMGASPVFQSNNNTFVDGFRMQISRKIQ